MKNDIFLRILLAVIAGFTYLSGAIPESVTFSELPTLPVSMWLLFVVNLLTAFMSPSMLKKIVKVKGNENNPR